MARPTVKFEAHVFTRSVLNGQNIASAKSETAAGAIRGAAAAAKPSEKLNDPGWNFVTNTPVPNLGMHVFGEDGMLIFTIYGDTPNELQMDALAMDRKSRAGNGR